MIVNVITEDEIMRHCTLPCCTKKNKTTEPYKNIPKFGKHTDPDKTKTINPGPAEPGYALPLQTV